MTCRGRPRPGRPGPGPWAAAGGRAGGVGAGVGTGAGLGNTVVSSAPTINYITQPIPLGPILDVIPYVSADDVSIQMTIIPGYTEFIGYDDPGAFVPQIQAVSGNQVGQPLTATLPLPRLRARTVTTSE